MLQLGYLEKFFENFICNLSKIIIKRCMLQIKNFKKKYFKLL